ncbi:MULTISPECIES: DUF2092 domain-containing protein [unclassified Streptomyces]|uniref:LolA family protein n=1 Tax=unclassified Streptomyces TaxID=2593676 RepID=UPI0022598D61|nr:DUF2092 domain-containing protein [Streptomyces sp. NBC_01500]MCX4548951.1 DUF2092 domain-containing protein [Streptomyces sp. NBC_01500]WSV54561.1 DUF2092 domain-containing protein [Streptomyces sp. NBC_01014]
MAPNDSAQDTAEATDLTAGRRKAARYFLPVAVAGVAAVTIGLVPALASSGDPNLPKITAQQLIEKIAASNTQQLSGTVQVSADLGIPSLGGMADSFLKDAAGGDGGASADPQSKAMELASGTHTLRVAVDGPDRQRVSLLGSAAEYSLIHNGDQVWAYDSKSGEVYHSKGDKPSATAKDRRAHRDGKDQLPATPKAFADEVLKAAGPTTSVTVDGTTQVAGQDAYQLLIKPKQSGSTIGSVRIAVDAKNGTPLKFTLTPSDGGKAAIDVGFTKVSFAKPSASSFTFTPPKGAKVTEGSDLGKAPKDSSPMSALPGESKGLPGGAKGLGTEVLGKGWTSVVQLDAGSAAGIPGLPSAGSTGTSGAPAGAEKFLGSLGDKVTGSFGSGTVFHTRLVNALLTDDGKMFVGTVDKAGLVKAADAAK